MCRHLFILRIFLAYHFAPAISAGANYGWPWSVPSAWDISCYCSRNSVLPPPGMPTEAQPAVLAQVQTGKWKELTLNGRARESTINSPMSDTEPHFTAVTSLITMTTEIPSGDEDPLSHRPVTRDNSFHLHTHRVSVVRKVFLLNLLALI